ncbi:MAG: hypothetical protein HPY53_09575 [Brevinematales bacterium]|nr:hypothetical protein [Brevinematales bacterium]
MKKMFISLLISLFFILISCSENIVVTNNYQTNSFLTNWYVPVTTNYNFPGVNGSLTVYSVIINSGVTLNFIFPTNNGYISANQMCVYNIISNAPYNPNTFRDLYFVIDGNLFPEAVTSMYNKTGNVYSNILNTYALKNGFHTMQPWLKVYYTAKTYYIPGDEIMVFVTNDYNIVGNVSDPTNDDHGYLGDFSLPLNNGADGTYIAGAQDITNIVVYSAGGNMRIDLYMKYLSTAWSPQTGFDHVSFQIYLNNPGVSGKTFLPKQKCNVPVGMTDWDYMVFGYGWGKNVYYCDTASVGYFGTSTGIPDIFVDAGLNKISFMVYANTIGNPSSLSNWQVYTTTFDFDGMTTDFRLIGLTNSTPDHLFHSDRADLFDENKKYTNAVVLDWVGPITLSN